MSLNFPKGKKSTLSAHTGFEISIPQRHLSSKENIDVLGEIREEPMKNIFISTIPPKLKASIAQTFDKNDVTKRSNSFSRMRAKAYNINYFDFYKLKKDFSLISDDERATLIDDLYEFDKCFYLNQLKLQIHESPDESRLTSR